MQAIPMMITKDEATAAQRTIVFYAVDATDGFTPETAIDFSDAGDVKGSKAGAALANLAGVVTELASGLYKLVLDAADVDTLGLLTILITNAGVRPIVAHVQVVAFDLNTASVPVGSIAANAITAASIAADVATELNSGMATAAAVSAITLATKTVTKDLGHVDDSNGATSTTNNDDEIVGTSTLDVLDVTFQVSGTWSGATATVQVCSDPAAAVPVWTDYVDVATDNPLTADGEVIVTGGSHVAARVRFTSLGAASELDVTAVIRKPAGT